MIKPSEILFLGIGTSSVLWYRIALPAMHLGADWCGVRGEPPKLRVVTGVVKGDMKLPCYDDYKLVIIQQPYGRAWLAHIKTLRASGIKVLFEVDDYLHGVAKQPLHDFAKDFTKERLVGYEICMRACDGLICSTDYIARRYAKFNRNIYVARNGLDLNRYQLTRPERSTINIGWAGATGHLKTMIPWLNETLKVMGERENTCLVLIGHPGLAAPIARAIGAERVIGIPFTQLECYPAAMCMLDIALAPAGDTSWYKGKSDLRWLEAGALGIPIIADPGVYPEVQHGVNGFHAATPTEMGEILRTVIDDHELRERVGEAARGYVSTERSSEIAAMQWSEICAAVNGGYESMAQLRRAEKN